MKFLNFKKRGGPRKGAGRVPLKDSEKKKGVKIYITNKTKEEIIKYGFGKNFSTKAVNLIKAELTNRKNKCTLEE